MFAAIVADAACAMYLTIVLPKVMMQANAPEELETVMSSKGQVVLPKAVRDHLGWREGTRVAVELVAGGVLLHERRELFAPTQLDDVFGCLRHDGEAVSVEDMDRVVVEEAARRHAGR